MHAPAPCPRRWRQRPVHDAGVGALSTTLGRRAICALVLRRQTARLFAQGDEGEPAEAPQAEVEVEFDFGSSAAKPKKKKKPAADDVDIDVDFDFGALGKPAEKEEKLISEKEKGKGREKEKGKGKPRWSEHRPWASAALTKRARTDGRRCARETRTLGLSCEGLACVTGEAAPAGRAYTARARTATRKGLGAFAAVGSTRESAA
eukprot:233555-Pleurochrysis_carterae.AAC.1